MSDKIIITRNQLAKFLPNPETIKAFENLFKMATKETPTDLESVAIDTATASASASEALALISAIQQSLDYLATEPNSTEEVATLRSMLNELLLTPPRSIDRVADLDYIQLRNTHTVVKQPGTLNWGYQYGHLQFTHIGGLVQELGLDIIIHGTNTSGVTISKGQVVYYTGATGIDPNLAKFTANGTLQSHQLVGIASEDFAIGASGHVTVSGIIRDVNASGSTYTETWNNGDLLYAHPTTAGGLTNVKPTAPNQCIPMAVVVNNSSTVGILYVRTTIEQQLYYGSFSDSTDQTAAAINTAYALTFNTSAASLGVSIGTPTSRIVCANSGLYEFSFSAQITSGSASTKTLWFWPRKNGTDIADTAMKASISGSSVTASVSRSMFFSMNAGDYIEAMWATDDINVTIEAAPSTAFAPATPSVIMAVSQIAQ
ncbi:MAG: capsid cement protein [Bdellovibrionales bacterium]|jgi:hypothetical protein